ncbi:hypothetical protein SFRURICE_011616 [Spodoptera frugiperda]|nr:hypothetical protein SFRURICE_011616 [Spodoptera frugiperda]
MLFYSALFVCFLVVLASDNTEVKKAEPDKIETIFADVIKNISRVNNVLQELINNYEQLQKVYISQENFDRPELSSQGDTEHSSQNIKKPKTPTPYVHKQAGTRMILSDTEIDKTTKGRTDKTVIKKTTAYDPTALSDSSDMEKIIQRDVKKLKQLEESRNVKKAATDTLAASIPQRQPVIHPNLHSKEDKSKESQNTKIIFINTQKKVRDKTDKEPKTMGEQTVDDNSMKLNPKYDTKDILNKDELNSNVRPQNVNDRNISSIVINKLHSYSIDGLGKPLDVEIQIGVNPENSKDVEKQRDADKERNQLNSKYLVKQEMPRNVDKFRKVTTEDPNDPDNQRNYASPRNADIVKSPDNPSNRHRESENPRGTGNLSHKEALKRPGNQEHPIYSKEFGHATASEEKYVLTDDDESIHINKKLKTVNNIAVSQIETATLRTHVDNKSAQKNQGDTSSDISDDDDALTKDMFKTSVLRQAYGDACLKLVVRKCYRACKKVYVTSCKTTHCKSDLKEIFQRSSRTGCIKEFVDKKEDCDSDKKHAFRAGESPDGLHVDITREGYLAVACQPQTGTGLSELRRHLLPNKGTINASNVNSKGNDIELNLLRDRYEKACQKLSRGKCTTACNYAQNATCVKFECGKKLKKNLRRNCKAKCRIAYSSTSKKKGSGSGSDSGSDSDDDDSGTDDSGESESE